VEDALSCGQQQKRQQMISVRRSSSKARGARATRRIYHRTPIISGLSISLDGSAVVATVHSYIPIGKQGLATPPAAEAPPPAPPAAPSVPV